MGSTFYFLAVDDEVDQVLDWFRAQPDRSEEAVNDDRVVFWFRDLGPLRSANDSVDAKQSPIVLVYPPRPRRGILWTAGEVHFLPTNLPNTFPGLNAIQARFRRWLRHHELVFSTGKSGVSVWSYWLEGGIRNRAPEVYALPRAFLALQRGQYFVADDDTDGVLDKLCRTLRLRGLEPFGCD